MPRDGLTEEQREEIARLIKDGFTSGRLDEETPGGTWIFTAWELKTEIWTDP
jgi:hypothetical protein